uniref:RRM domain-containing protein n=1 Tax=Syphacia muris TaxID=451379 RepID=A0A0N5AEJ5_9BILA
MCDNNDANERTCYVSNLHSNVTQSILEEMFVQMGPVEKVIIPAVKGNQYKYSFVIFKDPESVIFASQCLDKIRLYGMKISVRPRNYTAQEDEYKKMLAKVAHEKQSYLDCPSPTPFKNLIVSNQHYQRCGHSQSERRSSRGLKNSYDLDSTPTTSRAIFRHGQDNYRSDIILGMRSRMQRMNSPYSGTPNYLQSRYSRAEGGHDASKNSRESYGCSTHPYGSNGNHMSPYNIENTSLIMRDRQTSNFYNNNMG